jgi:hypothetical protein
MKILIALALCFVAAGCALTYSTDGKTRSFSAGFTPDYKDFKAIKDLR